MHVSTQIPSAARAKPLTRRGRLDCAAEEVYLWFSYCGCGYDYILGCYDLEEDGGVNSIEEALTRCYQRACGDAPLRAPLTPPAPPMADALPEALFVHVDTLLWVALEPSEEDEARWAALRPALAAARVRFDRATGGRFAGSTVAELVTLFAPFWVRPPEAWQAPAHVDPERLVASVVEHLFARYPAPQRLLRAWSGSTTAPLKWVCWYILFAQGGSLRRAARWFGWAVPHGFAHRFVTAPAGLSAVAACRYAEVTRLGGDLSDFARLEGNEGWRVDPTECRDGAFTAWQERADEVMAIWRTPEDGRRFDEAEALRTHWFDAAAWLIRHRASLTDAAAAEVLAWVLHRFTERARAAAPFAWRALDPQVVIDAITLERPRALLRSTPLATWRSRGWDASDEDGWTVTELTTQTALDAEGQAMQHCVADYGYRCLAGRSAVFSLRRDGERVATIEVDPRAMVLAQTRGRMNAPVDAAAAQVAARWIERLRQDR